jgi:DNA-binding GntR family transcriptional regulator
MAAGFAYFPATQPADLAELRLLMELASLRRLADRGLCGEELALAGNLADVTVRAARGANVPGYLRADMAFHLCLMRLTGEPAVCEVARLLLAPDLAPDLASAPGAEESGLLMVLEAREHAELVGMLADGMVSAADHLLRLHLSRRPADATAPGVRVGPRLAGAAGL